MGQSLLKWIAALLTGAAASAAAYLSSAAGPQGIDPAYAGIAVTILAKIAAWGTSKLPAKPAV